MSTKSTPATKSSTSTPAPAFKRRGRVRTANSDRKSERMFKLFNGIGGPRKNLAQIAEFYTNEAIRRSGFKPTSAKPLIFTPQAVHARITSWALRNPAEAQALLGSTVVNNNKPAAKPKAKPAKKQTAKPAAPVAEQAAPESDRPLVAA